MRCVWQTHPTVWSKIDLTERFDRNKKVSMKYLKLISIFVSLLASCGSEQEKRDETKEPKLLLTVPSTVTIIQRASAEVPGSKGRLVVNIGDISGEQVPVRVTWDNKELMATRSLREGAAVELEIENEKYRMTLERLTNVVIGDDSADFLFDIAEPSSDSQTQNYLREKEIKSLMQHLRELDGAVFIRNGKEYSVDDAIDHLLRKLEAAGDSIKTTEDFIKLVGTKSSQSDEPYQIRMQDGNLITTEQWFTERLRDVRKGMSSGTE